MLHVSPDQVASRQGTAKRQLTGQDTSSDNTGEAAGVLARARGVGATDTKHVKHGALGLKDSAAAEGTDFERGHGDRDLEGSAEAGILLVTSNK